MFQSAPDDFINQCLCCWVLDLAFETVAVLVSIEFSPICDLTSSNCNKNLNVADYK